MRPNLLIALLFFVICGVAGAQAPVATLEERMSRAEFQANGLDKLSPEELQRLNTWMQSHGGAGGTQYVTPGGAPVFYPKSNERPTVDAHIDGEFRGWRGKTVFKLDNGQEWQQAESGVMDYKSSNPSVHIKPMLLGSWLMYVDGCGCNLRVTRTR